MIAASKHDFNPLSKSFRNWQNTRLISQSYRVAMGLLDDLKRQADSLRQKQQVTQEEHSQNLLLAHAKLKDALQYWIELFNSLNVIKPVVPRYYYLEGGVTKLENLLQSDYNVNSPRLTLDHKDYVEAIVLRFHCVADDKLVIEKESAPMVKRLRDHLWANNLKFDVRETRNERGYVERGTFTVVCEVPVMVTIVADLENAQIKIIAKNLEQLGEYTYLYDFDEFGKELMEELAKVIIAQPNAFRTLGRHQAAMRTTTIRAPRLEADDPSRSQPAQAKMEDAGDPAKSFIGNIKSILKR